MEYKNGLKIQKPKEILPKNQVLEEDSFAFNDSSTNFEDLGFELVIENEGCNSNLMERKRTKSIIGFLDEKLKGSSQLKKHQEGPIEKHIEEIPQQNGFKEKNGIDAYLENIKFIYVFIQTEICVETLDDYLVKRNEDLYKLRGSKELNFKKDRYMKDAIIIIQQVIMALNYIHNTCNLVHRDLKPSNIFLNDNLLTKIGDFGLVKKIESLQPMFASPLILSPRSSKDFSSNQLLPNIPIIRSNNSSPDLEYIRLKSENFLK